MVSVRAKKKDGQWRQHILYRADVSTKYVQDSSLSRNGFYTRERLTAAIEHQNRERERGARLQKEYQLPVCDEYVYGSFDLMQLNETYRAYTAEDGTVRVTQRSDFEKHFLRQVKDKESFLRRMEARGLHMNRLITPKDMQDSLDALRFLEVNKYKSPEDIQKNSMQLRESLEKAEPKFEKAKAFRQQFESLLRSSRETGEPLPEKYQRLDENSYSDFLEKLDSLSSHMESYKQEIEECDRILRIIRSIPTCHKQPTSPAVEHKKPKGRERE